MHHIHLSVSFFLCLKMLCVRFCGQSVNVSKALLPSSFLFSERTKLTFTCCFTTELRKIERVILFFWLHAALYLIKSFFYFPFLNIINRLININIPNDETTSATVLLFPFAFQREILQQVTPTYQGEKYQQMTVMGQTGQEVQVSYKVNAQNFNLPLRFQ